MQNDKIYKTDRLTIFVSEQVGAKLRRLANRQGSSLSSYCYQILKKHVEEKTK